MKTKIYNTSLHLSEFENNLLKDLSQLGWKKSEIIRMAIRYFHTYQFSDWSKKRARKFEINPYQEHKLVPESKLRVVDDITPKEYCEKKLGGRITEVNGVECCEYPDGSIKRIRPLNKIKNVKVIDKIYE